MHVLLRAMRLLNCLIGYAIEAGRAMVIAINKWDNMSEYDRKQCKLDVERRFDFIPWAKIHLISALHGTGVGELYPSIHFNGFPRTTCQSKG
jgi:GTPase